MLLIYLTFVFFICDDSHMVGPKHVKSSNPITGLDRPLGLQEVEVVSPTHRLPLPPRKDSWYSFLLEAESTPGP
jgi:hypothetical protein